MGVAFPPLPPLRAFLRLGGYPRDVSDTSSSEQGFGRDPKPYYLAFGVLAVLELLRRAFLGYVPDDFTAYLSAADAFVAGLDVYTPELFDVVRYNGKPYNYFPGTLYLIAPLAWVPTAVAASLDWVARVVVLVLTLRYLHRRILPDVGFQFALILAVLCEPLMVDMLFGNLVTYLLGAWACCVWLSEGEETAKRLAIAVGCGVLLAFKPFWFLAAGYPLFLHRKWKLLAATVVGAALIGVASLTFPTHWWPQFFAHTQKMRDFYYSIDLLNLAPALLPVAALVWGGAAIWLDRKGDPQWAWLFGCVSIPVWPRLATYSYTLMLPVAFYLIRRWGWAKGLAYSAVLFGPIPWLLRVAPWVPGERLENWTHFVWTMVTGVVLFLLLRAPKTAEAT